MIIPISFLKEQDIKSAISSGDLCKIRDDQESGDFEDEEFELVCKLEDQMISKYGEKFCFVSNDIWMNRSFTIQVSTNIVNKETLVFLIGFLNDYAKEYCIDVGVVESADMRKRGGSYLGHLIINLHQIVVESTLKEFWDEQIEQINSITLPDGH